MSPESNGPIPVENQGIPIPPDEVTPEMRANAIGSPDRTGEGVLNQPEVQQGPENPAELGSPAVAAEVQVIGSESGVPSDINEHRITREEMIKIRNERDAREAQASNLGNDRFANMFDPNFELKNPEDAAVREPQMTPSQTNSRFAPPTDAQIERGKQFGFDLEKQEKYHSPDEWAARNNPK